MIRTWLRDWLAAMASLVSVVVLIAVYVRDRNAMELA